MSTISIFVDKEKKVELPSRSTGEDLAKKLNLTAPDQALAAEVNGKKVDLSQPLHEGDCVRLIHFASREGKEIFWHSSAHILAQAVLRLWPNAKPTIGPAIEQGFYYDFADLHVTDEDLEKIEKEMEAIVNANYRPEREVLASKKAGLEAFRTNKYKLELIQEMSEEELLTAYRQGEFFDLCRGPHLPALGKIKALKILKTSGAYWRADPEREMLTRIYGITFPDRKMLKEYLTMLAEAKKRDHKVLGPKLDLFSLHEEAAGMPFFHPKGMEVWKELLDYWKECHDEAGYTQIKTPIMMSRELWERSGHWQNYRQNMYTSEIEKGEFAIKPMNCPGCMLYYKTHMHSYREFPLRIAEIGLVHRHEASGSLSGLVRVRSFHQDDAHIFMEKEQIKEEIIGVIRLMEKMYATFGLRFELELSTRPKEGSIGTDADWEYTTNALKEALNAIKEEYVINEGEGAFYGPKIDGHIRDALGRKWQCSTIQLDMSQPERFDLTYVAADGSRKRPVMIHRVIYGSIERFFGVLIEHYAGRFPLWLSPEQVRLIPVADRHLAYAKGLLEKLKKDHFRCSIDETHESVGKKIRAAQLDQVNYMLTLGDREQENQTLSIRSRSDKEIRELPFDLFLEELKQEKRERITK